MIARLIENFKKTELYTNKRLITGLLMSGVIGGYVANNLPPDMQSNLLALCVSLAVIGIPMGVLLIYDGLF
jgi:uncharacterized membrane protein YqgA involved in biofilm formation